MQFILKNLPNEEVLKNLENFLMSNDMDGYTAIHLLAYPGEKPKVAFSIASSLVDEFFGEMFEELCSFFNYSGFEIQVCTAHDMTQWDEEIASLHEVTYRFDIPKHLQVFPFYSLSDIYACAVNTSVPFALTMSLRLAPDEYDFNFIATCYLHGPCQVELLDNIMQYFEDWNQEYIINAKKVFDKNYLRVMLEMDYKFSSDNYYLLNLSNAAELLALPIDKDTPQFIELPEGYSNVMHMKEQILFALDIRKLYNKQLATSLFLSGFRQKDLLDDQIWNDPRSLLHVYILHHLFLSGQAD